MAGDEVDGMDANVVALVREPPMQPLIQPYLAGRLSPEAAARFEETLLESRELQDAVALHRAMRDGLESMGQVPHAEPAAAPEGVFSKWRRWLLGV